MAREGNVENGGVMIKYTTNIYSDRRDGPRNVVEKKTKRLTNGRVGA